MTGRMKHATVTTTVLFVSALARAQSTPAVSTTHAVGAVDPLATLVNKPGGLTADHAAERAAATSREAAARRADVALAGADVDRAEISYYPRLTLTGRYTRLSSIQPPTIGPSDANLVGTTAGAGPVPPGAPLVAVPSGALTFPVILNQYLVQANVTVPISDYLLRTSQTHAAAKHSKRAAVLNERAARRQAALRGRLTYYAWVRARLQEAVARQTVEQASVHVRLAEVAHAAQRLPKVDVLRAESQLASAELLLKRAAEFVTISEDDLRTTMHDTSARSYAIGEDPLSSRASLSSQPMEALYAHAVRHRPEVAALDAMGLSLSEERKAAEAASYPRLDAFGNAYYANPNQRYIPPQDEWHATWDVGVQVTWSPNDIGNSSAAKRALDARRAKLAEEKRTLEEALHRELVQAYQAVRTAEFAVEESTSAIVAAEEAYRGRKLMFEQGRATTVELVDAETELVRARFERVNAHLDLLVSRARLDHALGGAKL